MADDTEATNSGAYPLKGYATIERRKPVLADAGVEYVGKKTLSPSTAATDRTEPDARGRTSRQDGRQGLLQPVRL